MESVAKWQRAFRMWHYAVSYHQLLLRSLQDDPQSRIDVLFSNVHFLHMPAKCERLAIDVDEEFSPMGIEIPAGTPGKWFIVNEGEGFIYATHCQWHEDDGNAMTPSKFGPLKRTD